MWKTLGKKNVFANSVLRACWVKERRAIFDKKRQIDVKSEKYKKGPNEEFPDLRIVCT